MTAAQATTQFPGIRLDAVAPEITLLAVAVIGLTWGMFLPRNQQHRVAALGAIGLIAATLITALQFSAAPGPVFNGVFAADRVTMIGRLIILAATIIVFAISVEHTRGHAHEAEYYVLMLLSSLGSILMVATADTMLLVAAYLLSSVPLYMLAAFRKDSPGTEAALKTYLMAAMFLILLMSGMIWLYGASGQTLYPLISERLPAEVGSVVGVALVLGFGGMLFKIGAVPGHFWLPDAAEGAPAPVAAFLTTVPKIGGIIAGARLLAVTFPVDMVRWDILVAVLAVLSMTLGNLAALWQRSPRRLLGYSAVAQAGYLLIGMAALPNSSLSAPALLYFLAAYVVTNLAAWAVLAELPETWQVDDYVGLLRRQPGLAVALAVALFSLAGIPPLAGFVGKLLVFTAAWDAGLRWLVVVAAVNVVISLFYYLRWIAPMFADAPATAGEPMLAGKWAKWSAYSAAALTLLLGIFGRILVDPASTATFMVMQN
jgi:NADH-quinone oxidoreductase subunit N